MRRTASSTICFQERSSRLGTGKDMMATSMKLLAACQIEREYEIVDGVGGADFVAHVDEDPLLRVGVGHGLDLDVADAELELGERLLDVALVLAELDAAVRADGEGELEADAEKVAHVVPDVFPRLCGGDTDFDDPLAGRTGDDGPALPFLDLQAFRSIALGADQSGGAAGVHCLDDLVPDGLE